MENIKVGIALPFWMWMNDLLTAISYLVCFGSLVAILWMLGLGYKVAWYVPIVFALLTALFGVNSRPYTNTKQAVEQISNEGQNE